MLSVIDVAILAIIALSGLIGALRGLIRELLSLVVWVASFAMMFAFSSRLASLVPETVFGSPGARLTVSALALFGGTFLVGIAFGWVLRQLFAGRVRSMIDRILGFLFGLVRGLVLVSLLVLLGHLQPEMRLEPWWQSSRLLPYFDLAAREIHKRLPEHLATHFSI